MSKEALAAEAGVCAQVIYGLEHGYPKQDNPTLAVLTAIAKALGVSVADLVSDANK